MQDKAENAFPTAGFPPLVPAVKQNGWRENGSCECEATLCEALLDVKHRQHAGKVIRSVMKGGTRIE